MIKKIFLACFVLLLVNLFLLNNVIAIERPNKTEKMTTYKNEFINIAKKDIFYTVKKGDTLAKIALRYYYDADYWVKIYNSNNLSLMSNGNPLIHNGNILKIPYLSIVDHKGDYVKLYLDKINASWFSEEKGHIREGKLTPMFAYSQITGKGKQSPHSENLSSYFGKLAENTFSDYLEKDSQIDCFDHFEQPRCVFYDYLTVDASGENFALRATRKRQGHYVALNGKDIGHWNYADQLVFSPVNGELSYRAKDTDDNWYFVSSNGNKNGPWSYVDLVVYTENGDQHAFVKNYINDKEKWHELVNGKIVNSYDYIDMIMYFDDAKSLVYRAKQQNADKEEWFIVIDGKKERSWDYVDDLSLNIEKWEIKYRARDFNGEWLNEIVCSDTE